MALKDLFCRKPQETLREGHTQNGISEAHTRCRDARRGPKATSGMATLPVPCIPVHRRPNKVFSRSRPATQTKRQRMVALLFLSECILEIKGGQHSLHERHDAVTRHPMLIHRRRQVILFPGSTRKDPVTSGAGVNYAVLPTFIPFGKLGVADSPGKIEADEPQPATKG